MREILVRVWGRYYYHPAREDGGFFDTIMKRGAYLSLANCEVCAKGAFLVAHLRQNDRRAELPLMFGRILGEVEFNPENSPEVIATGRLINEVLSDCFDVKQLQMIEVAFEGVDDLPRESFSLLSREEQRICTQFGIDLADSTEVLRAICNNILRNDGTFRPETG